jgi:hypothetical protein
MDRACWALMLAVAPFLAGLDARAAASHASAEIVDQTVFLKGRPGHGAVSLRSDIPQTDLTRLLPFRSGAYAMVELTCDGFRPDGRLEGCKIRVEPDEPGYAAAGVALSRHLRVERSYAAAVKPQMKFILVQLRLVNSDVPAWKGPCWAPSCAITPPPPPARSPTRP